MKEMKSMIGKNVHLWPSDTTRKEAKVLEINEYGFVFEITLCDHDVHRYGKSKYEVGEVIFVSHSSNLIFKVIK